MNTEEFNEAIKPLSDKWTDDLVKDGLFNKEKIQSLAEDILKLHRPDPQYSHHESSCRKCNSTEIDTVVVKQKEEIDKLKKELDNSKFGSQCSVHELEYDKKTLIKENTELKEEIKKLEDKTKYLIPYCFECGAEYEDKSCCPDKSISYIHPRFLKELKEAKFGVQQFRS